MKKQYIEVKQPDGSFTYGGNQAWLSTEVERSFGCGFIAAADILRYLRGRSGDSDLANPDDGSGGSEPGLTMMDAGSDRPGESESGGKMTEPLRGMGRFSLTKQSYLDDIRELAPDFRVRGKLGITGFGLARRMNRIFRREKLPYRSKWSVGRKRLERRLFEMLEADIPVLLSVGPGFFHKGQHLPLYRRTPEGNYERANSMRDHYVTVTGVLTAEEMMTSVSDEKAETENVVKERSKRNGNETMLRISSWGHEYYINFGEYLDHVRKYDNFLFSSILYIRAL